MKNVTIQRSERDQRARDMGNWLARKAEMLRQSHSSKPTRPLEARPNNGKILMAFGILETYRDFIRDQNRVKERLVTRATPYLTRLPSLATGEG